MRTYADARIVATTAPTAGRLTFALAEPLEPRDEPSVTASLGDVPVVTWAPVNGYVKLYAPTGSRAELDAIAAALNVSRAQVGRVKGRTTFQGIGFTSWLNLTVRDSFPFPVVSAVAHD